MLRKLKLKQSDNFDSWVATREMAGMVVKYLDGQPHARSIGSEQGLVGWDDFVIEEDDESHTYVQVKRQTTPFCEHSENRRSSIKTQGKNKGEEHDLSPFDKAIADLGNSFLAPNISADKTKQFKIALPNVTTKIKENIEVRHFNELCTACFNETTVATGLETRALSDNVTLRLFEWLTTWCGFRDWPHIILALRHLSISFTSLESDIQTEIDEKLCAWFTPADQARQAIFNYIQNNATDTGAATPKLVLKCLDGFRRADKPRWIQYKPTANLLNWEVAGTIGSHDSSREMPRDTVPFLWGENTGVGRILRIGGDHPNGKLQPLPMALLRLALHLPRPGLALVSNAEAWQVGLKQVTAGTLGNSNYDVDGLPLKTDTSAINPSDIHRLDGIVSLNDEANNLHFEMDKVTWQLVRTKVSELVLAMSGAGDLQPVVSELWQKWHVLIESDTTLRSKLLLDMLTVACEGTHIQPVLRVGPETVGLLVECLLMHLTVAVALDGSDAQLNKLNSGQAIRTLALSYWGGPAGSGNGSRQLITGDSDDDIATLLGKETDPILIYSGVADPANQVFPDSLADDLQAQDNLAAPRRPDLLLTNCRTFKRLVASNSVEKIKKHISNELKKGQMSREKNIEGILK